MELPTIPPVRKGRPPGSKNKPKRRTKPASARDATEKGTTRIYATGQGTFLPLEPLSEAPPPPRQARTKEFAPPAEHPKGYTRVYVDEGGKELAVPVDEPTPHTPHPAAHPEPVEVIEVAIPSDAAQKEMIDEYGELDRLDKMYAPRRQRYEQLKGVIKGWVDPAPADADAILEGDVYRLHLTARERERRVRDLRELLEVVGLDKLLELVSVRIGPLEDLLGKARVAALCVESRTGSRRIRAVPKFPAGRLQSA